MPHHHEVNGAVGIARRLARAARRRVAARGPGAERPADVGAPARPPGHDDGPLTTLDATLRRTTADRYTRLVWGPGEPHLVRADLGGAPGAGRKDARRSLLYFAHHTDVHLNDAQSPARLEPGDRFAWFNPGADGGHRPQETCTTQVFDQMVRATNAVRISPLTGAEMAFCIQTGDNTDTGTVTETTWFLDVLNGGRITPNTGAPGRYEGIQRSGIGWAWQPDQPARDHYSRVGFPTLPDFLDAAVQPFDAVGLDVPWLAVMGNHDSVFQGTFGPLTGIRFDKMGDMLVGSSRKPIGAGGLLRALAHATFRGVDPARWDAGAAASVRVTPDAAARRRLDRREYVQAMLDDTEGPGPVGHGFTPQNVDEGTAWWSRPHRPHVQLIGLDTCNHTRGSEGALSELHWQWLEAELRRHHTRWRDARGRWVEGEGPDRLCILFSHHNSWTMTSTAVDDHFPGKRYQGGETLDLLHRFPNVVLWVNGHSHENKIVAHPRPAEHAVDGAGAGFWEVNTASCIDFGQQSRTIELVDNGDGTLSAFTTVLDHAAAPSVAARPAGGWTPANLAGMSRELSANDARWTDPFDLLGDEDDRNTELLIPVPFPLT